MYRNEIVKLAAASILIKTAQGESVRDVMINVMNQPKYRPNIDVINPASLDSIRNLLSGGLDPTSLPNYGSYNSTTPLRNLIALQDSIATRDYPRSSTPSMNTLTGRVFGMNNPLMYAAQNIYSGVPRHLTNMHPALSRAGNIANIGIGEGEFGSKTPTKYDEQSFINSILPTRTSSNLNNLLSDLWLYNMILNHENREIIEAKNGRRVFSPSVSHDNISFPIEDIYQINTAPARIRDALQGILNMRSNREGYDYDDFNRILGSFAQHRTAYGKNANSFLRNKRVFTNPTFADLININNIIDGYINSNPASVEPPKFFLTDDMDDFERKLNTLLGGKHGTN